MIKNLNISAVTTEHRTQNITNRTKKLIIQLILQMFLDIKTQYKQSTF